MSVVSKGLSCLAVSSRAAAMLPMLCGKLDPGAWKVAAGDTLMLDDLVVFWPDSRMGMSLAGVMVTVQGSECCCGDV